MKDKHIFELFVALILIALAYLWIKYTPARVDQMTMMFVILIYVKIRK